MKHTGGHKVGKGTYWNFDTGERIDMGAEGILPGDGRTVYYRLPASGIVAAGPFLGLLYAAFLPFIGIAMLLKFGLQKAGEQVMGATRAHASFGWRPSESYLAGGKKKGGKETKKDSPGAD